MTARGEARSRGVALIAALWVLTLLSVIAGALLRTGHTEQRIARAVLAEAETRALAEAGLTRGLAALLARDPDDPWRLDGTPRRLVIGDAAVTVAIQDELGKIDLNAAEDGVLHALFVSLGLAADAATSLVDAIGDWRDADDLRRARGAEAEDYRAAGLAPPRNGPFESVDKLAQVKGMTRDLLARARPALTVLSRRPFIDPATAPREALAALPGLDRAKAEALLRAREAPRLAGPPRGADGTSAALVELAGRAFTLTATATPARGAAVTRTLAVRLTGDPRRPYLVQDWR